jgi:hypothetical protein
MPIEIRNNKNKGGRPKGSTSNPKKIKKVSVLFTEADYSAFISEMEVLKIKTGAKYLYLCWKNNKNEGHNTVAIKKELVLEIKKIGTNINQIAFQLNSRKGEYLTENMIKELKLVAEMQEKLFELIKL